MVGCRVLILGPVVAVQTQKFIERATENRRRKRQIFIGLMANRATRLNDDYVRALNMIDIEFLPGWWRPVEEPQRHRGMTRIARKLNVAAADGTSQR